MERKIYNSTPSIDDLEQGDSIIDPNLSDWEYITNIPQDVAETWLMHEMDMQFIDQLIQEK